MSCISCVIKLCNISLNCDNKADIVTPLVNNGTLLETYTLELKFLDSILTYTENITPSQEIVFKNITLNENYCYSFQVKNSLGDILSFGDSNTFEFCTQKKYQ